MNPSTSYPTIADLPEHVKNLPVGLVDEVSHVVEKMVNHEAYGQP